MIPPSQPPITAYAVWSPTGQSIACVIPSATTASESLIRVTSNGNASLFNGVPDWVHEGEVFSSDFALWRSPDWTKVAFPHLDETLVEEYMYLIYNPTEDSNAAAPYPDHVTMKYPKPGYHNPIVVPTPEGYNRIALRHDPSGHHRYRSTPPYIRREVTHKPRGSLPSLLVELARLYLKVSGGVEGDGVDHTPLPVSHLLSLRQLVLRVPPVINPQRQLRIKLYRYVRGAPPRNHRQNNRRHCAGRIGRYSRSSQGHENHLPGFVEMASPLSNPPLPVVGNHV